VAIVRKRLGLGISLYTFLQVLSVSLFEKTPILQAFQHTEDHNLSPPSPNQLNLFHF
ncbi:MAG TPA: IS4 family transposase, partial [Bryobacteraceae bacterium]|nr:IS4 family transposase [Bryobacteraceae bacterium]